MGLKGLLNKATGDEGNQSEFDEQQVDQLLLAEQEGVPNTECRKHNEWGPTLMNYCWNREKEGKPIDVVYKVADYLKLFPTDKKYLYDDMNTISYGIKAFECGRQPIDPLSLTADRSFDKDMFKFVSVRDAMIMNGDPVLWSGRISMNNTGMFNDTIVMGEGIPKAVEIASQLQSWAINKRRKSSEYGDFNPEAQLANNIWNSASILLRLDDMNIRGYQLLYAMEYTDGSIEKLYEILDAGRTSSQLVDYINMRSAKDYLAGDVTHNQVAVDSLASFCYDRTDFFVANDRLTLNLDPLSAEQYAKLDIQPIKTDWASLDICNTVDLESHLGCIVNAKLETGSPYTVL